MPIQCDYSDYRFQPAFATVEMVLTCLSQFADDVCFMVLIVCDLYMFTQYNCGIGALVFDLLSRAPGRCAYGLGCHWSCSTFERICLLLACVIYGICLSCHSCRSRY